MRRPVLVLVVAAVLFAACSGDDDGSPSTTTAADGPATTVATTVPPPATEVTARVYFARDGRVAAAGRGVEPPAVARGALEALLAGPSDLEADLGLATTLPEGTAVLDVTVAAGTATVDLNGAFLSDTGESLALRVAQVVFTLTQFPTVERVTILIEGASAPSIGLEEVPVAEVSRDDFAEQTPFILVEAPTPGAGVASPVEVSGLANTFEANVRYEVTGADGSVLDDGFTTASAGSGTWGTFSFTTDLPAGAAVIEVFQESAEDGSRVDVVRVPVNVS